MAFNLLNILGLLVLEETIHMWLDVHTQVAVDSIIMMGPTLNC